MSMQKNISPWERPGDYLCLVVHDDQYGIRTSSVKSVLAAPVIRRVPKAPSFVRGVANVNGMIVPVLDMAKRFGTTEDGSQSDGEEIVLVQEGNGYYALLVDSIEPIVHLSTDDIEPVNPILSSTDAPFFSAMARVDDQFIHLLDVAALLHTGEKSTPQNKKVFDAYTAKMLKQEGQASQKSPSRRTLLLAVGEEEYGVVVSALHTIMSASSMQKITGGPNYLAGVVTAGKVMLPVIDLQKKFGLDPVPYDQDAMVAMLTTGKARYGVLANGVNGIIDIDERIIKDSPVVLSDGDSNHIKGVAMLDQGRRLTMLLDEAKILDDKELSELKKMKSISVSPARARKSKQKESIGFIIFSVAGVEFALPVKELLSAIEFTEPKKVPKAPAFVRGIIQVEGELVSVIDLRKRFDLLQSNGPIDEWIIIIKIEGKSPQGILADSVSEIRRVVSSEIAPAPEITMGVDSGFINGVIVRKKDPKHAPIILDVSKVVKV